MANATKLPSSTELNFFHWQNQPILTSGLSQSATDNTAYWSAPPTDENGAVITGGFLGSGTNKKGETEVFYVPPGTVSADGLSATGIIRGIDPRGLDYTVGNTNFIKNLDGGSAITCVIAAQAGELMRAALQGDIATGSTSFVIGTDTNGTVTVKRSTGVGTNTGMVRWNSANTKVEFSNDGTTWTAISDSVASSLVKASATDTTPGYLGDKLVAGANMIFTKLNVGGNEVWSLSTALPLTVGVPATYTEAYLLGGNNGQALSSNWLAVLNGSFRITINGIARNIDGINFTGVTSMTDVVNKIQAAIRAVTGGQETVSFVTNHFIIRSGNNTITSSISTTSTSTGTVGTDISGLGASPWLDCAGGLVTPRKIDLSADVGKAVILPPTGPIHDDLTTMAAPTGMIAEWVGRFNPSTGGWLLCDGSAVSRTGYNRLFEVICLKTSTIAISIGTPCTITLSNHNLVAGDTFYFESNGTLPTGLSANTIYYVLSSGLTTSAFQFSATKGGIAINSSGTQTGIARIRFCPFGLGDGSTTFNLPDFRGRVPVGVNAGTFANLGATGGEESHVLTTPEIPAHRHDIITNSGGGNAYVASTTGNYNQATFQTMDAGGGGGHNNLQPYIVTNYIIKT